jgi:peptidoglycan hydrolase-like amidase
MKQKRLDRIQNLKYYLCIKSAALQKSKIRRQYGLTPSTLFTIKCAGEPTTQLYIYIYIYIGAGCKTLRLFTILKNKDKYII